MVRQTNEYFFFFVVSERRGAFLWHYYPRQMGTAAVISNQHRKVLMCHYHLSNVNKGKTRFCDLDTVKLMILNTLLVSTDVPMNNIEFK